MYIEVGGEETRERGRRDEGEKGGGRGEEMTEREVGGEEMR